MYEAGYTSDQGCDDLSGSQGVAQSRFRRSQRCQKVRLCCGLMSRPATLLVREVDFLMIYSHPIASDLPRGSKTALTRRNDFAHRPSVARATRRLDPIEARVDSSRVPGAEAQRGGSL